MFGIFVYDFLFLGIPAALVLLFVISIYLYVSATKKNIKNPGTFSAAEIKGRKVFLIVSSVLVGVLAAIVIGIMILLSMAVAYM